MYLCLHPYQSATSLIPKICNRAINSYSWRPRTQCTHTIFGQNKYTDGSGYRKPSRTAPNVPPPPRPTHFEMNYDRTTDPEATRSKIINLHTHGDQIEWVTQSVCSAFPFPSCPCLCPCSCLRPPFFTQPLTMGLWLWGWPAIAMRAPLYSALIRRIMAKQQKQRRIFFYMPRAK